MAARIGFLTLHHRDLSVERIGRVISDRLPEILDRVRAKGVDLDDPYTVWELLGIDAVISLEDIHGRYHRVAVSIVEREERAYRLMKKRQTCLWQQVRGDLGIDYHWVFCVDAKHFPDDGEWIDLVYHQIDLPHGWSDCRSINL
jgi:hypothetical protein